MVSTIYLYYILISSMAQKCLYFLYIGCYKNRFLVPETGLEPACTRHMLLRHTCIPISPLGPVIIISQVYRFYSATSLIAVFNSSINCFETARFSSSLISTQVLPRFSASKAVAIGKPVPLYGSFTFSWLIVP